MKRTLRQQGLPDGLRPMNDKKPERPPLTPRNVYDHGALLEYFAAAKKAGMHPVEMANHLCVPLDELIFWTRPDRIRRLRELLFCRAQGKR